MHTTLTAEYPSPAHDPASAGVAATQPIATSAIAFAAALSDASMAAINPHAEAATPYASATAARQAATSCARDAKGDEPSGVPGLLRRQGAPLSRAVGRERLGYPTPRRGPAVLGNECLEIL